MKPVLQILIALLVVVMLIASSITVPEEYNGELSCVFFGAVVVCAGAIIGLICRYNEKNRREILESRVNPTRALAAAMRRVNSGPRVWLNAASATWYRDVEEKSMDEWNGEKGKGFSVDVCQAWEEAMPGDSLAGVRQVILRITMVLGHEKNSVYPVLSKLVRRGLGGRQGSGVQFVSWIHQHDFVRAVEFLIDTDLQGPVNIAAPNPVTNHCFMRLLRQSLGWKIGLPANDWMIEVGALFMRTESELVLKSRRVVPGQLLKAGFSFHYPTCSQAFEQLGKG